MALTMNTVLAYRYRSSLSLVLLLLFAVVRVQAAAGAKSSPSDIFRAEREDASMPLVSVIVPTINRSGLLHHTLEQLADSTYENLEVVIVDDSPVPEDVDELQSLLTGSQQTIVYHHSKKRMTIGSKRNLAVDELSSGEYLIQVDDDDLYSKDRIEYQVMPLIEGRAQLTVLEHYKWMLLKEEDDREKRIEFYKVKSFYPTMPHYGTIAFSRQVWNEAFLRYPDASFAEDKAVWKQAMEYIPDSVLSVPNESHHVYVRHGEVTNPTYGHPDSVLLDKYPPEWEFAAKRLSTSLTPLASERELQEAGTCGCCISANACFEYEEAWDIYGCTYYEPCGSGEESPAFFELVDGPCDTCDSGISCADKYGSFDGCPRPTPSPTNEPTPDATPQPSPRPSPEPSSEPSPEPSPRPTLGPTPGPTVIVAPSIAPILTPPTKSTPTPTNAPTTGPVETLQPSPNPTIVVTPSPLPLMTPAPAAQSPTPYQTKNPTLDTMVASLSPSSFPSRVPSLSPSLMPSHEPSLRPTEGQFSVPTSVKSIAPSISPTPQPNNDAEDSALPGVSSSDDNDVPVREIILVTAIAVPLIVLVCVVGGLFIIYKKMRNGPEDKPVHSAAVVVAAGCADPEPATATEVLSAVVVPNETITLTGPSATTPHRGVASTTASHESLATSGPSLYPTSEPPSIPTPPKMSGGKYKRTGSPDLALASPSESPFVEYVPPQDGSNARGGKKKSLAHAQISEPDNPPTFPQRRKAALDDDELP